MRIRSQKEKNAFEHVETVAGLTVGGFRPAMVPRTVWHLCRAFVALAAEVAELRNHRRRNILDGSYIDAEVHDGR